MTDDMTKPARVGIRLVEQPELWWCVRGPHCANGWATWRRDESMLPYPVTWVADTPLRWCDGLPMVLRDLHGRKAGLCFHGRDEEWDPLVDLTDPVWSDTDDNNPAWATRDGVIVARVALVEDAP